MQSKAESAGTANAVGLQRKPKDLASRERLATEHLPLVRRLCERYRYSGVPMEDLAQIGSVGLIKAIDKFDPNRGTKLLSFAVPVIMGEMRLRQ